MTSEDASSATGKQTASARKQAFVLMPFANPYNGYFVEIFRPALRRAGYSVMRADDIFTPGVIMRDIVRAIESADLILCEMSGKNPNVFYELGLAHSRGKPVILVSRQEDDIPFDLRHLRVIYYGTVEAGWERKLSRSIVEAAKAAATSAAKEIILADLMVAPVSAEPRAVDQPTKAYDYYAQRYGWGYDELRVTCTIAPDGSAIVERDVTVTAHRLLDQLEQSLNVEPAAISQTPALSEDQIAISTQTYGTRVSRGKVIPINQGWVVQVLFQPPVPPGNTVSFHVRENLGRIFAINYSPEKLAAADIKEQYFNWRIDRPTLHFHSTVHLPVGFEPAGSMHWVLFPPIPKDVGQARRHTEEEQRLELLTVTNSAGKTTEPRNTLELDVHLPILGMVYMIRWDPLNNR